MRIGFANENIQPWITSLTTLSVDPALAPVRYRARNRASIGGLADGAIPRRNFRATAIFDGTAGALSFGLSFFALALISLGSICRMAAVPWNTPMTKYPKDLMELKR